LQIADFAEFTAFAPHFMISIWVSLAKSRASAMPLAFVIADRDQVIQADHQRLVQAGYLAECQLGPAPDYRTRPAAFKAYNQAYIELADKILARLN
jgi:hypothetical protein